MYLGYLIDEIEICSWRS